MENNKDGPEELNQKLTKNLAKAKESGKAVPHDGAEPIIDKSLKSEQYPSMPNSDHSLQVFIENMAEAAIVLSKEGIILYNNPRFLHLIEASEAILGASFLDYIQEVDRQYFIDFLCDKKCKTTELSITSKKQKKLRLSVSESQIKWKDSQNRYLLLTDITKFQNAQHLIEATEALARILSMDITLQSAAQSIIEVFNNYFGWEVLIIWIWNNEKHKLQCAQISHIQGININTFAKKTREDSSEKMLLSSHISSTFRPIWIEDVSEDPNFLRRKEAKENGLRGAFAFPFIYASMFGGVVELYRRTPYKEEVDGTTLDAVTSIGIMLGLYIERITSNEIKLQLSRILCHAINNIYKTDLNGIIIDWNLSAEKNYGWTSREVIGSPIEKLYPEGKSAKFFEILKDLLSGKSIEKFQSLRIKKNGELFWVENSYEETHNIFGDISGVCVVEQDITSEKKLESDLLESNEKFQSYIEISQEWIWEIDRDGILCFSNDKIDTMLGYAVEEILGKNILYFIPIAEREKFEHLYNNYIAQKKGWLNIVVPCLHKNGTLCWHESSSTELRDGNDELTGFRGTSRDITKAIYLEKIKEEFVSVVNHELRTPLTSIYGALTLLTQKELDPQKSKELLTSAQRNALRLTKLIDDVTDIEKLQLGKLKYDFKKLNMSDVILESINSSQITANTFGVKIVLKGSLPVALVNGDNARLLQVLMNLLSNAIKFSSSQGTIQVSIDIINDHVRVSVEDFGPGIPKEFQSKIFEKFAQADSTTKRSFQGTGLGLNISKSIVEGHGGTIQFKTKEGEGTTFFFEIPLYNKK